MEKSREQLCQGHGTYGSDDDSQQDRPESLCRDLANDIGWASAERHAQADLSPPLCHCVAEDSVDTDDGENESQGGEEHQGDELNRRPE